MFTSGDQTLALELAHDEIDRLRRKVCDAVQ
jgi:hypothetical protein